MGACDHGACKEEGERMKEIVMKIIFLDDEDYYKFMDDMGCADEDEDIRIPTSVR